MRRFHFNLNSLICLLFSFSVYGSTDLPLKTCTLTFDRSIVLKHILLADTPKAMQQGLSKQIHIKNGMLFSFKKNSPMIFWMKDTSTPLSVGFFSNEGELFQIETMMPFSTVQHASKHPGRWALELPEGLFQSLGLTIGTQLKAVHCTRIP